MLEDALAVAERTCLAIKRCNEARRNIQHIARHKARRLLDTVGSDVLHWCSPDRPRNQCHVFESTPALFHRPCDDVVPYFTSTARDQHIITVDRYITAHHTHDNHQTRYVVREEHIATSAENAPRQCLLVCPCKCLTQFIKRSNNDNMLGSSVHTERGVWGEVDVSIDGHRSRIRG